MTDTSAPSPSFALTRPAHVDTAHLVVEDLDRVSGFYRDIIGLTPIEGSASGQVLGVSGVPLLTLSTDRTVARAPRTAAGLFHTAFLVPNRRALGAWLAHAAHAGVRLDGASDHLVSEAIYLSDPEGNGIEIYRDRTPMEWTYLADGTVQMATDRLDLQALYDSAPKGAWGGMEDGTAIGHIHLQVGNIPEADSFYRDVLGLKIMARYPGASFFATGGYHHHVAANIWNSRGAGTRSTGMTGLANYTLKFNDPAELKRALASLERLEIAATRSAGGWSLKDPWGIGLTLSA
ncbi:catechol 2,3-dioxygenase [Rhizobium sp. RU35A]|uniref:VOC family protein n=1 Tax=Rhizobium sp. RU35A TaxID=1907414 RepID=UPI0009546D08|nr:VOC family protein [Rhizobium sp. RU35A]SIP95130.1 catechol 2,3-dioxygenase [Rhizobium sp. RU35A]